MSACHSSRFRLLWNHPLSQQLICILTLSCFCLLFNVILMEKSLHSLLAYDCILFLWGTSVAHPCARKSSLFLPQHVISPPANWDHQQNITCSPLRSRNPNSVLMWKFQVSMAKPCGTQARLGSPRKAHQWTLPLQYAPDSGYQAHSTVEEIAHRIF